jgi:hypothetical protein
LTAQGTFVKKLLPSLSRHGQYRGAGRLEVTEAGVRITGSHVMTLGERWLAGVVIGFGALLFTGGLGLAFIYLIVEYALVRRDDRDVPFAQIVRMACDPKGQLVGLEFEAETHITPAVLRSPDSEAIYAELRARVPSIGA